MYVSDVSASWATTSSPVMPLTTSESSGILARWRPARQEAVALGLLRDARGGDELGDVVLGLAPDVLRVVELEEVGVGEALVLVLRHRLLAVSGAVERGRR